MTLLVELAWRFALIGLLAIGGANAVAPEIYRQVVEVQGWLSPGEFAALFALGNAAPGPNVLLVTLVGWKVSGLSGAFAATAAMIVPTSVLTYWAYRVWERWRGARWRAPVQNGLSAVTIGLVAATGYILASTAATSVALLAIAAGTALLSYATRLNPLWAFAAAAGAGAVGLT